MALQQWVAWVHSGAGTHEEKAQIALPDNLYVAFYVPPGRQLGKDLARHVFKELYPQLKMKTLDEIDKFHKTLRGQIRSIKRTGITPASALELHTALNFTDWPRILGKGYVEDTRYLLNYQIAGPTADDTKADAKEMALRHLGSGNVMRFGNEKDRACMRDVLDMIRKCSGSEKAILHFLGCREEAAHASQFGGLFAEKPASGSRQQIRLN